MPNVLTSTGRLIELPVSLDELKANEKIVASDCLGGMLYVREYKTGKSPSLHNRQSFADNSDDYVISFISLPNIDIYLEERQLSQLQNEAVSSQARRNMQHALAMDKTKHDVDV